jgi:hypothetical protein
MAPTLRLPQRASESTLCINGRVHVTLDADKVSKVKPVPRNALPLNVLFHQIHDSVSVHSGLTQRCTGADHSAASSAATP